MNHSKIRLSALLIFLLSAGPTFGQLNVDSSVAFPFVRFQYAFLLPGGDFEDTFGNTSDIGGAIGFKTKSNWQFDIESGLFFGADVKRRGLLRDIINDRGDATDSDGELVRVVLEIRGFNIFASGGKIIPISKTNRNSGILIKAGVGYMQHRIKADFRDGEVFQLSDENMKGYDRLHTGIALRQFIGFQYYGTRNLLSFYIGVEFNEGFTINRRGFNYDERAFDTERKQDILSGIRFGWTIPIRDRSSEEFYYY